MSQVLRPISDILVFQAGGGIAPETPFNTPLWSKLNLDSDQNANAGLAAGPIFGIGSDNAQVDLGMTPILNIPATSGDYIVEFTCRVGLTAGVDPGLAPHIGYILYEVFLQDDLGGIAVRTFLHGWDSVNLVYTYDFPLVDPVTGPFTTFSFLLTEAEKATFTDWANVSFLVLCITDLRDVPSPMWEDLAFNWSIGHVKVTVPNAGGWFYNPYTNHFEFGPDPGAPWISQTPTLIIDAVNTTENSSTIDIHGIGIGDGATVTVNGVAVTNVVVVDANHIRGTITPLSPGYVKVIVTNPDGGGSGIYFLATVESSTQWKLQRFDVELRTEKTS